MAQGRGKSKAANCQDSSLLKEAGLVLVENLKWTSFDVHNNPEIDAIFAHI